MASIAQTDVDVSTADSASFSFTSTIGSGDGARTLFVLIHARRNSAVARDFSSVTVNGVAAEQVVKAGDTSGATQVSLAAIYKLSASALPDPTVSSATVNVVFTGTMNRGCACAVAVTADAIAATATDTATGLLDNQPATTDQHVFTLDVEVAANGFVLGIAGTFVGSGTHTIDWSGATEQSDALSQTFTRYSTAYASNVAVAAPRAVSCTVDTDTATGVGFIAVAVASFAPAAVPGIARAYGVIIG